MIRNERQLRTTRTQAEAFRAALESLEQHIPFGDPAAELKWQIQRDALRSQHQDLQRDIDAYLSLQTQAHHSMELNSLEDLPNALIKARIASGLTQKQLAERLGMKEQQVQRYESTGYTGANLNRLQEIIDALGIKLKKRLLIPELPVTTQSVIDRLSSIGLKREFIESKLLSPHLRALADRGESGPAVEAQVLSAADSIGRMFDWSPELLFSSAALQVSQQAMVHARFKVPANAQRDALPAYTIYAHYLALLMIQATPQIVPRPIPPSWRHVRQQILDKFGEINLSTVVQYIWDLGVVIVPLNDAGHFHGATWRFRGRNVIVIKQKTGSEARWIIDLLHELWHAAQRPESLEHATIEAEELYQTTEQQLEEEIATDFAADIVFKGKADELAEMASQASNGRIEWLKTAVQKVAAANGVRVDLLANYLAFRVSREGQNWWGAAAALQESSTDPWSNVRDYVVAHINWELLHGTDRMLLEQAFRS